MADLAVSPTPQITPLHLLQLALEKESNIDVIERIARMQREERAYQAEVDFNAALSRCQARMKRIAADSENAKTKSRWPSYAALDRVLRPLYTEEGFSISFSEEEGSTSEVLKVIAYVCRDGHTRVYRKTMPVDTKGPSGGDVMTKTHAAGSADSYAKRYLLKDIFNVAVGEDDDDGNGNTDEEHARIIAESADLILKSSSLAELQERFTAYFGIGERQQDKAAMHIYTDARDKRRAELEAPEDELWAKQLAANETLEDWNKYVIPVIASKSTKHQQMATAVSHSRGWKYNRTTKVCEVA